MARLRRSSEQTLALKIELAQEKVARTREAHEKAVDELKKTPGHSEGTTERNTAESDGKQHTYF